jgi:hypothetical protein
MYPRDSKSSPRDWIQQTPWTSHGSGTRYRQFHNDEQDLSSHVIRVFLLRALFDTHDTLHSP